MKKISVLLFIVLSFIVFNLGTEVKAKEGIGQVGKSALVCAYCVSNNDCYYVIQDVNEEPNDDANIDDEYQRIFKNTFSNEIELQNGGIIFDKNYYISILPTTTKCYNYMHYIHGGSDKAGENSSYDYYYYAFDDDQYIDVESDKYKSNIKGLYDFYIQSDGIINYEFVYQYGLDSYGKDEDEIDNDKIVEELKNIISSNKLIIDNKYNNSNNSGDVDEWDGDIDEGCSVDHSSDLACGSLYFIPKEIPFFTNLIMNLIKIATPIILVIKGSIDLIKAMTGGNEQEISKSRSKFFKRLIPAVLVFLIILVVQFIFGLFATDSENNTFLACSNCFLNNKCSNTPQSKINEYCSDNGQGEVVNPGGYNPGDGGQGSGGSSLSSLPTTPPTTYRKLEDVFPNGIPSTESEVKKYLTTIDVPITKKDGTKTTTKLTLHKDFANDVKKVFQIAQDNGFKIYDAYCYSWRNVAGSSTKSAHSYGLACDINPKENYCYCISSFSTCTIKNPTTGKTDLCYDGWWKPGIDEYSMAEDSSIVRAFYSIGWGWGGNWKSKKDYMHFSYTNN